MLNISLDMFKEELEILFKFTFKESLCVSKFTTLNIKQLPVGERGGRGTLSVGRMEGGKKYYFWEGGRERRNTSPKRLAVNDWRVDITSIMQNYIHLISHTTII